MAGPTPGAARAAPRLGRRRALVPLARPPACLSAFFYAPWRGARGAGKKREAPKTLHTGRQVSSAGAQAAPVSLPVGLFLRPAPAW